MPMHDGHMLFMLSATAQLVMQATESLYILSFHLQM